MYLAKNVYLLCFSVLKSIFSGSHPFNPIYTPVIIPFIIDMTTSAYKCGQGRIGVLISIPGNTTIKWRVWDIFPHEECKMPVCAPFAF